MRLPFSMQFFMVEEGPPMQTDIIPLLLTSGVAVAIVTAVGKLIDEALKWRRERKAKAEDKAEEKEEAKDDTAKRLEAIEKQLSSMSTTIESLRISEKAVLSDRIKHLGTRYLEEGEIDFDDRRNLHDLHNAYHNHCGGNGDYDILMEAIDELPLKRR